MLRAKVVVALYPFRAIEGGDLSLEKVKTNDIIINSVKILVQEDSLPKFCNGTVEQKCDSPVIYVLVCVGCRVRGLGRFPGALVES